MSHVSQLSPPILPSLVVKIEAADKVSFAGTIATPNPSGDLGGFFKALHAAVVADGLSAIDIDVTKLTFVNSSAIRLLVDWSTWVRKDDERRRYQLRFLTNPQITWQKTSLPVLRNLAPGIVVMEP
jgi:hypothetical protein